MAMAASQCMILTARDEPALPSLRLFFFGLFGTHPTEGVTLAA